MATKQGRRIIMNPTGPATTESASAGSPSGGSFRLPRLEHARVEDAMRPGVISVPSETPLREVARMLSTRHIHCLVVTESADLDAATTWGLISSFDLVLATIEGGAESFEQRAAGELAGATPPVVIGSDSLDRAVQLMVRHGAEHLLVAGAEDRRPVGLLSTLDIAGVLGWGEA
jgi:CBS domain-containing protein